MAVSEGGFAGVTAITEVVSAAAQAEIIAEIEKVKALIADPTVMGSSPHTDFDRIGVELATKLRAEFDALIAAVDAAPTA